MRASRRIGAAALLALGACANPTVIVLDMGAAAEAAWAALSGEYAADFASGQARGCLGYWDGAERDLKAFPPPLVATVVNANQSLRNAVRCVAEEFDGTAYNYLCAVSERSGRMILFCGKNALGSECVADEEFTASRGEAGVTVAKTGFVRSGCK